MATPRDTADRPSYRNLLDVVGEREGRNQHVAPAAAVLRRGDRRRCPAPAPQPGAGDHAVRQRGADRPHRVRGARSGGGSRLGGQRGAEPCGVRALVRPHVRDRLPAHGAAPPGRDGSVAVPAPRRRPSPRRLRPPGRRLGQGADLRALRPVRRSRARTRRRGRARAVDAAARGTAGRGADGHGLRVQGDPPTRSRPPEPRGPPRPGRRPPRGPYPLPQPVGHTPGRGRQLCPWTGSGPSSPVAAWHWTSLCRSADRPDQGEHTCTPCP